MTQPPLLEVRSVSKRFPGVLALDGVDLDVGRGELVAVVGENGAGKSTLMKIMAGVQTPDSGELRVDGRPVRIDSVRAAHAHGIALIHQELDLCDNLDVAGNVYLGREPRARGLIDRRRMASGARAVADRVGLDCPTTTVVSTLPIGRQQLVEIAKALIVDARLLIMDEPTSSLSARESEALFAVIRELRAGGVSIVYISHRLAEVRELADRVVVLRDGRNAGQLEGEAIEHDALVRLMVGRDVSQFYARRTRRTAGTALVVEGLGVAAHPTQRCDFEVRAGEIVGLAGLVGSGRTELLEALFGVSPRVAGTVRVAGDAVPPGDPRASIRAGLALVPEDRKLQGLVLEMSVRENLGLASLSRDARGPFVDRRVERERARSAIADLAIKTPDARQVVRFLSGGNQQKVVLGKWLALEPKVLLLDEPTRGIDVGAKHEIYALMEDLAERGVAILFASSELEEILGISDRVLVLHEGRLAGALERDALDEEAVMRLATGGAPVAEADRNQERS